MNRLRNFIASPASFLMVVFFMFGIFAGQAQKKERLRISATYIKHMDGPVYLDLQTTARIDRSNVNVPHIPLDVYYEVDGEETILGEVQTDGSGKAQYRLENLDAIQADSSGLYILGASFGGNETFRKASRSVEFRDAIIESRLVERDSIYYVEATLKDAVKDSVVADALIGVMVERMFQPLRLSEEFLMTDEAGSISVEVPDDIPGMEGNLVLLTRISEHDTYGNVEAKLEAPIGVPIVAESDYEERTLWGRASRAPYFILFFTGILVIGSWGLIAYLFVNLYRIAKN